MLTNWQIDLTVDKEVQTSDATTYTLDLPRDGHISMLDIEIGATNDTTSNKGYSQGATAGQKLMDVVTELKIIANGSKTLWSVTNVEDLIAESIKITGKIPARTITEKLSAVQKLHIPIYFGRFVDDKLMVIPNGAYKGGNFFDNLQLKMTYNLGVTANTKFATGTFQVSVTVKKLIDNSPPEGKLVKTFMHKTDYTTVSSTTKSIALTYGPSLFLRTLQVYCYEHSVAEGADISKVMVEYNSIGGGKVTPFEGDWRLTQMHNAQTYGLNDLTYDFGLFSEDADNIYTHVPNVTRTAFVSDVVSTKDLLMDYTPETITGDDLELAIFHSADAAAAANAADCDFFASITSNVVPGYLWIDFDESKTMNDLLDTGGMTSLTLKLTDAAAGGAVRVAEEMIMRATDFRSS